MSADQVEELVRALALAPGNAELRLLLAEALTDAGRQADAAVEYARLLDEGALPREQIIAAGRLALEGGNLQLAARLLERAKNDGVVEGVAALQLDLERELTSGADSASTGPTGPGGARPAAPAAREALQDAPQPTEVFTPGEQRVAKPRVSFADVIGLEEAKKALHRATILPYQRPDLYLKYGRSTGGGVLLYGPPGCGKTLLARATAGECGLPFHSLPLEDLHSAQPEGRERGVHQAFERIRLNAPCVLLVDELDRLTARGRGASDAGRPFVEQLVRELDATSPDEPGLVVLAASSTPWDVDDALTRPGRLARRLFVPPPGEEARAGILELLLLGRHAEDLDLGRLAASTPLFSGADLRALVEAAVDLVIDEALDSGTEPPLRMEHMEMALSRARPTTLGWLRAARELVEPPERAGRYEELASFLRSPEAGRLDDPGV